MNSRAAEPVKRAAVALSFLLVSLASPAFACGMEKTKTAESKPEKAAVAKAEKKGLFGRR